MSFSPGSTAWLVLMKEAVGSIGASCLVASSAMGPPAAMNMVVLVVAVLALSSWLYGMLLRRHVARQRLDRGVGHVLAVLGDPRLHHWRMIHAPLLTVLAFLSITRFALLAYFHANSLGA